MYCIVRIHIILFTSDDYMCDRMLIEWLLEDHVALHLELRESRAALHAFIERTGREGLPGPAVEALPRHPRDLQDAAPGGDPHRALQPQQRAQVVPGVPLSLPAVFLGGHEALGGHLGAQRDPARGEEDPTLQGDQVKGFKGLLKGYSF